MSLAAAKLVTLAIFDPAGQEETKRRLLSFVSFQPHLTAEAAGGRSCDLGTARKGRSRKKITRPEFLKETG